ncbi:MAG: type IV pilus biogenesis/stability protein PilW [Methylobacter sp.]|nr:type IV pilus biogenesis/stability protein PilW [Methylobacter sp.]MDP2427866.1 type IV pilus biogenesis/stability protein PilW [Methylobacter sp.]MDP3053852.1 type IV pilus biogenesis/stability protein PilW [Methylobacter sp.]MDP3363556.1 type IV pilus biogenesis/stability protein PilW [Methylobacter sp.]MDZ4217591.1 type IV pilus biogenesis/stability protein PilW [Methylobacter sp.]
MRLKLAKLINYMLLGLLMIALPGCGLFSSSAKRVDASDIHLQLGVRYLGMNKLELARENLLLSLKGNSDNAQAHNALAFLYEKLGQHDKAKDHYETALNLLPNDLSVKNNFGRFLCEHDELEAGMVLLSQASSSPLNDRSWLALTNAGRCQLGMGQKQLAENYFKQALQYNKTYSPALAEMQKIAYQNGDFWASKGYLQRYLGVANHTAETLLFAAQTEQALGNKELAREYKNLLLEKFPLSNEAQKIVGLKGL